MDNTALTTLEIGQLVSKGIVVTPEGIWEIFQPKTPDIVDAMYQISQLKHVVFASRDIPDIQRLLIRNPWANRVMLSNLSIASGNFQKVFAQELAEDTVHRCWFLIGEGHNHAKSLVDTHSSYVRVAARICAGQKDYLALRLAEEGVELAAEAEGWRVVSCPRGAIQWLYYGIFLLTVTRDLEWVERRY